MRLQPLAHRVQIRVNELTAERFTTAKGRTKSLTIYETSLEEVWAVIEAAISKGCKEDKSEAERD